jgi:hypothetical protein
VTGAVTPRLGARSVPVQEEIRKFLLSLEGYPFREGQVLNASNIDYRSLKAMKILEEIRKKGIIGPSWQ